MFRNITYSILCLDSLGLFFERAANKRLHRQMNICETLKAGTDGTTERRDEYFMEDGFDSERPV